MGLDIYGVGGSPPCRAVYLVAKAIGLDYNFKKVDMNAGEHRSADFLKMNPAHTVPTMNDSGLCLGERCGTTEYLTDWLAEYLAEYYERQRTLYGREVRHH